MCFDKIKVLKITIAKHSLKKVLNMILHFVKIVRGYHLMFFQRFTISKSYSFYQDFHDIEKKIYSF